LSAPRDAASDWGRRDFIQTDAAINRGTRGALINARGELVGINTAIFSETGGGQAWGSPCRVISPARRASSSITGSSGAARRRYRSMPLTTSLAEPLSVRDARGLLVRRVLERSAAYAAGLRPGDIIIQFNGTTIEDASQFVRMLSDAPIGSTATLGVITDGRQRAVRVPIVQATAGRAQRRGR
jgi:S1-C subfamily serine protease